MLLSSTAPLPNNTLTPIPQSWVDERNARIGMLTLLANRAKSITDCYAPASSFLESSGPVVAAQVAAAQANASTAAIASGTSDGTPSAPSSGDTQSSVPAPMVLPLNSVTLGTPGGSSVPALSSCSPRGMHKALPQPQMMMPQPAPAVIPAPPPTPTPPATQSSYPAPQWTNLCWAMRNGAVIQSQFAPSDYQALDWACSQKGYTGACPPPPNVEQYLAQGNLPTIPVSQAVIDAIPNAPNMTGVPCSQSYVMAGLSGIAPAWGTYSMVPQGGGVKGLLDMLGPLAILVAAGWGLSQMAKGMR